ncbi:hypothetical protein AWV80_38615 [Cupriavidus sp. UYMU48A]|nr:hypothetical protein AWV80_38615 [Cupriavidus sp. UYMU48A]
MLNEVVMNPLMPLVAVGWLVRIIGLAVWVVAFSHIQSGSHVTPSEIDKLTFATIVVPVLIAFPDFYKSWKFVLAYGLAMVGGFTVALLPHANWSLMLTVCGVWTFLLFAHPRIRPLLLRSSARMNARTPQQVSPIQPQVPAPTAGTPAQRQAPQGNQNQPAQPPTRPTISRKACALLVTSSRTWLAWPIRRSACSLPQRT